MDTEKSITSEVWDAEDGRCEACGRAMHRQAAILHIDRLTDPPRLICPLCDHRITAPFGSGLRLSNNPKSAARDIGAGPLRALAPALDAYGVVINGPDEHDAILFWLPCVGHFRCRIKPTRNDGTPRPAVILWGKLYPEPTLEPKPQARTRGLPRLSLPIREGEEMPL